MSWLALGLGLVLVIEGLVLALAPSRIEDMLATIAALGRDQRRVLGLVAVAAGVGIVGLVRAFGG
ncbi:DUF2065 domain-containing protein [Fuscibacter oryzae]|jgi:hypothetical protein|uniref:DUF2065 domain-containing protein n=1 Tax=Fuscibacter oryzae TaxID=2803939 RepID=A0A8J7SR87_9RHOB|nr:DUF2065 domain-containing protein [Fuscibacter oryzae]MBL4927411.1 DUF2065 domain-containing protein [Fuscibacter oryzae]